MILKFVVNSTRSARWCDRTLRIRHGLT